MKTCKACGKQSQKGHYCYACAKAIYRKNNPIKAAYQSLRSGAKRRGKAFNLTFEQFKTFVVKTEYMKNKGTRSESYHIDRIDETKGYTIDNIQIMTNSENVRKYYKFVERINNKPVFSIGISKPVLQNNCPF